MIAIEMLEYRLNELKNGNFDSLRLLDLSIKDYKKQLGILIKRRQCMTEQIRVIEGELSKLKSIK
jgi:hypothetical protein